jgi:Uncharacterized proteins of the AP superfamily
MISIRLVLALAVAALSTACSTTPAPSAAVSPPTLMLVSIDGLRADMLDRGATPNLQQLAREGVHAEGMRPSYPSLTFPNHYTIVTGLRPDRHGIVHNSMWEDGLGMFRLGDRDAVTDARWWGGEPLWVSAEKAGLPTATWSWPGSEAPIQGVRPRQWRIYDESVALPDRVEQVLRWLQQPGSERPRLVTLYMEHVDKAGHDHGPDSDEYRAALEVVDGAIGLLLDGLRERQLLDRVDLVVVSDHGMAAVPDGHAVLIEDMVPATVARVVSAGQSVGFAPLPGQEEAAERPPARRARALRLLASRTAARALALRQPSADPGHRLPDGGRLGRDARRLPSPTQARHPRCARLRPGAAVDAGGVRGQGPVVPRAHHAAGVRQRRRVSAADPPAWPVGPAQRRKSADPAAGPAPGVALRGVAAGQRNDALPGLRA